MQIITVAFVHISTKIQFWRQLVKIAQFSFNSVLQVKKKKKNQQLLKNHQDNYTQMVPASVRLNTYTFKQVLPLITRFKTVEQKFHLQS